MSLLSVTVAPPSPRARLTLGITGHGDANPAFAANSPRITAALEDVFDIIQTALSANSDRPNVPRLHSLLAEGTDQLAARSVLARGWELVAPLPFGRRLNAAINARPTTPEDGLALLAGAVASEPATQARARALDDLANAAQLFELAEHDAVISAHFLARLTAPEDLDQAQLFAAMASERVALAARVMIEQSDILVAVWDGASRFSVGGTGHTIYTALSLGAPVVWIDARTPEAWRILRTQESIVQQPAPSPAKAGALLSSLVRAALVPPASGTAKSAHGSEHRGPSAMDEEVWEPQSHPLSHAYRRIEALFGGDRHPWRNLRQTYEPPEAIGQGSGAGILAALKALPGGDPALPDAVEAGVLRRFAWADGVSARLSDIYRGSMTSNFLLSAAAIISGVAYLPFVSGDDKGPFAAAEFLLLATILGLTWLGQKRRWHGRWFETRRVAEYFRHAPILIALGVARPVGRWPKGLDTSWPEWYARQGLREIGLPRATITAAYLRAALENLLDTHVSRQRDYHIAKAQRLTRVHRNLDRLSELSFLLAVISVALCLGILVAGAMHLVTDEYVYHASKWFTLTGVILPTLGAAIAGIRYFGDFERFAAISEVTAEKLDAVHQRIGVLLAAPEAMLDFDRVSDLAHTSDDIVVSEIENWQSVFGGKHITVPV
jgi:hypothetical protein